MWTQYTHLSVCQTTWSRIRAYFRLDCVQFGLHWQEFDTLCYEIVVYGWFCYLEVNEQLHISTNNGIINVLISTMLSHSRLLKVVWIWNSEFNWGFTINCYRSHHDFVLVCLVYVFQHIWMIYVWWRWLQHMLSPTILVYRSYKFNHTDYAVKTNISLCMCGWVTIIPMIYDLIKSQIWNTESPPPPKYGISQIYSTLCTLHSTLVNYDENGGMPQYGNCQGDKIRMVY